MLGNEELKKEKYLEALNYYEKINCVDKDINTKKKENSLLCYQELGKKEEEKALSEKKHKKVHYKKAIDYYEKVKKNNKLLELNFIVDKIEIEEIIKINESTEKINYFVEIFDILNNLKKEEYIIFLSSISSDFLILLIRLSIISLKKNCLEDYIQILDKYDTEIFENKKINSLKIELILELKKYQLIPKRRKLQDIEESIKSDTSEIKKRFYLSALIVEYLEEKGDEIISILEKKNNFLKYLTLEGYSCFLDYFKKLKLEKEIDLDKIYSASKLLNSIIVSIADNSKTTFAIIGQKIIDIYRFSKKNNSREFIKIFDVLIIPFQELLANNTEIIQKEYEDLFLIFLFVIKADNKFLNIASKGLLFLSNKNIDFNLMKNDYLFQAIKQYSTKNENLLEILISQFRFQEQNNIEYYIETIYEILLESQKLEVYESNEEKIINFLLKLDSNILLTRNSLMKLNEYLKGKNIHPLVFKLIEKIPDRNRYPIMTEKLKYFEERLSSIKSNSKNIDLKERLAFTLTITKNDLIKIEKKLDEQYFIKKLILFLKRQKDLINDINIEEVTKHFSLEEIDLLNLIIENKIIFNEKSLLNLLKGFYINKDIMIFETMEIFNKIKSYQKNLPFIIEKNLNIEEFLYKKNYEKINSFSPTLIKIFEDFSFLKGFSKQHQYFILYLLNLSGEVPKDLIHKTMLDFMINKNYDIGIEIYDKILEEIRLEEFIRNMPDILINKLFAKFHGVSLDKLYNLLKSEKKGENIILILKSFKFFFDYIELPERLLELLISLMPNNKNNEINKEIIYILGNYFSIKENSLKQEMYLDYIINIVSVNKMYQFIKNNIKTISNKEEIFYLYACVNYLNFSIDNPFNENDLLKIPQNSIIDYMKTLNENLDNNLISGYINTFNKAYNFGEFSPERDHYLRQLYFNNKKNSLYKLKLLCD